MHSACERHKVIMIIVDLLRKVSSMSPPHFIYLYRDGPAKTCFTHKSMITLTHSCFMIDKNRSSSLQLFRLFAYIRIHTNAYRQTDGLTNTLTLIRGV